MLAGSSASLPGRGHTPHSWRITNAPGYPGAVSHDFAELAVDERRRIDRGVKRGLRDKDGNVLSLSVDEYNMFPKWVAAGVNGRRGNVSDYTELPDEFLSNLVEEQPKVQRSTELLVAPTPKQYEPIAPAPVMPQLEEPEVIQAEPIEPEAPVFPGVYPLVKNKNGSFIFFH